MDDSYVSLAIKGDKQALEFLLNKNRDIAFSIAFKYVKDETDAEDIVQDAFVKVFLNIEKFRNESAFSTWLFRIIYIESIRCLTSKKKLLYSRSVDYEDVEYSDYIEVQEQETIKESVTLAMDILTENEYMIVSLYYLSEMNVTDIGKVTNQSKSNVKVKLHRARKKMSDYLTRKNERQGY